MGTNNSPTNRARAYYARQWHKTIARNWLSVGWQSGKRYNSKICPSLEPGKTTSNTSNIRINVDGPVQPAIIPSTGNPGDIGRHG